MLLKDLCTPDIASCAPGTTVLSAARTMRRLHVGDLVVVDDAGGTATPLGVITDRDIVVEVLGRELDPATVRVEEVMRKPVVLVHGSEDATQAVERMRAHGVRRVPVVGDDRRLIGIVSLDDLLRQLAADATALAQVVTSEQSHERRTRR